MHLQRSKSDNIYNKCTHIYIQIYDQFIDMAFRTIRNQRRPSITHPRDETWLNVAALKDVKRRLCPRTRGCGVNKYDDPRDTPALYYVCVLLYLYIWYISYARESSSIVCVYWQRWFTHPFVGGPRTQSILRHIHDNFWFITPLSVSGHTRAPPIHNYFLS